jgi:hypothetical protein
MYVCMMFHALVEIKNQDYTELQTITKASMLFAERKLTDTLGTEAIWWHMYTVFVYTLLLCTYVYVYSKNITYNETRYLYQTCLRLNFYR